MSANEIKPPLRDAEPRALIQTELDRNVMVLAGAGAGKTHELVGRMIALLRSGRVEIERIAAITFTRKAAGELRSRFMWRLRETLPDAENEERVRLLEALRHADRCFMGTIHAFCSRLLRERPVEGRVPPDFSELEAEDEEALARREWDRFIRACYAADDPRLLYLEEAGITTEHLYDFFRARTDVPELDLRLGEVPAPDLQSAAREAVAFMEEVKKNIPSPLPVRKDPLMRAAESVLLAARNRGLEQPSDAAALLELLPAKPGVKVTFWAHNADFARELRDGGYEEFYGRVIESVLRRWREHLYPQAAGLVDEAVKVYAKHREQTGQLTFADLLLNAARMLRESSEARAYFRDRYPTILVDEFQDTDPIQAEILLYLTATDVENRAWRTILPRPGSLFLVGDEKQSIYRFRRADVATFRFMRDRIVETGGLVVHLNTSFRSLGNLCEWINEAYPRAFREGFPDYQTAYGELFRYRADGADPHCVRTIRIPPVKWHRARQIVDTEAERIAAFIRAAIDGRTPYNGSGEGALLEPRAKPSDFLILTRYSRTLGAYAAALEKAGVAYDVTGSKGLRRSEEVRALVELLRVVHEPDHPVHYVAFLRGLCVGLADDALYRFSRAGGVYHPARPLPEGLPPEDDGRFAGARELVAWAGERFREMTPAAALEAVLDRTGLLAYARSQPLGSSRAGNLLRLVSFVRALEDRHLHWGEIVSELAQVVEEGAYDLEEMTLSYGGDDAVRIMNIHQAKGLQAKVVFLADPCGEGSGAGVERHVARVGDDPHLSIRIMRRLGDFQRRPVAQPVGWEEDAREEEKHQAAEEVRLLYVAGTRAENLLVVSVYEAKREEGRHGLIYPALEDLEELENFPVAAPVAVDGEVVPPPFSGRREQIAAGRVKRYRRGTVTGAGEDAPPLHDARAGKGRDFGTIVHRVLEDAVLGRLPADPGPYVRALCDEAGLEADARRSVLRLLDHFRDSEVWRDVERAEDVFTEVDLGLLDEGEIPLLVRGKIDLVYRHERGWKIVDYKTDVDASTAQLPLDLDHYARQVRQYAAYWERVTGEPVISCGLYGTIGAGGFLELLHTA